MSDVASYFESKGDAEKAVQLYQKAGDIAKALDLCFKAGGVEAAELAAREQMGGAKARSAAAAAASKASMFEVLRSIAADLDDTANPQTVARCAEFFIEHGQFDKAVSERVSE
jgi:intraflagellar transport protein 140